MGHDPSLPLQQIQFDFAADTSSLTDISLPDQVQIYTTEPSDAALIALWNIKLAVLEEEVMTAA
jgi:hypothetical protein